MDKAFVSVIHSILPGTRIRVKFVYGNEQHNRYTLRLTGPWQALVRDLRAKAANAPHSKLYPPVDAPTPFMDAPWTSILIKMQPIDTDSKHHPHEDRCQHIMSEVCPDIAPRFIMSMNLKGIRITFMEWLNDCVSVHDLCQARSPVMDIQMIEKIRDAVRRMWLDAGILHGDMHLNNVLIRQSDKRVFIIDFGLAIRLPEDTRKLLEDAIGTRNSLLRKSYNDICKDFALKRIKKRGYEIGDSGDNWNDDGTFLRDLYKYGKRL